MATTGVFSNGEYNVALFWITLVIIFIWFFRTVPAATPERNNADQIKNTIDTELVSSLKSRKDAWVSIAKYSVLLTMEIIDGYWLFVYWWRWTNIFNPWRLDRNTWLLWLWKCIVPLMSAVVVIALTFIAFMVFTITVVCLYELWVWEPKQNRDAPQILRSNKQGEEKLAGKEDSEANEDGTGTQTEGLMEQKQEENEDGESETEKLTAWIQA